jgi:hypothetical protein
MKNFPHLPCVALCITALFLISGLNPAAGQESLPATAGLDPSFRPLINSTPGTVRASAVQPDGKLLAGGYFRTLNGARHDGTT